MRAILRWIALALLLALAIVVLRTDNEGTGEAPLPYEEHRVPAQNPPVEPDRPDLFEEQAKDSLPGAQSSNNRTKPELDNEPLSHFGAASR